MAGDNNHDSPHSNADKKIEREKKKRKRQESLRKGKTCD